MVLEYAKGSLKKLEESVIQGRGIDQGAVKELDALLPELRATQIAELSLDKPKEIEDKNNNVTYKISTDVDEDNVISLRVEQVKPDAEIQQEAADKAKKVQELCTAESPVVPEIRAAIKEFNRTLRALSPEARAEPLKTLPFADPGRTYVNGAKDFYVKITIQDEHVQLEDLAESDKNHEKDTQKNYQDAVDAVRTKPFAFVEGKIKSANAELAQMTPEGRTGAVKRILRESTYDIVGSAYHVQFKREADRITVANLFKPEEKPDNNDKEKKLPPAKDAPVGERRELKNGFIVEKKTGEIWYRVGGRKPDLDENFPRSYTDKMVDTAGAKILSRESANIPEIRTIKEKYVDNLTIQKAMQELVGDNYWVVKVSAMEVNGKPTVRCELNSMVAMSTGPGRIATERLTLDREIDLKNPPTPEDLTREFTFRFIASRDRDGHSSEADGRLKDMIKKEPKDPAWKNELAWKYAIRKDSTAEEKQTAEKLAKEACLLEPNNYEYMDTLAAALAANGKFGDAMGVQAQAIEAAGANNPKLAEFQARLKLYKQEKPYVEGINSSNKPNQPNAPQNGQEQNTEELSMREKQERWTRSMENIHETLRRDPTLKVIQPSDTALTVSRGGVSIQFSRDGFAAGNVSSIYTRVDRFYDGKPEQMNSISLAKWNVENVKDFLEVELPDANNNQIKQYSENIHGTDITGTPEATLFFKYEVLKARDNRIFDRVTGKSVWKMEPGETIDLKTDNQGRVTMRAYDKEEKKYFNFTFERDGSVLQHGPEEGSVSPDRSSTQQDLMRQLSAVPANILSNYTLSMQSNGTLVINPRERDPGISTRSVQAQRNAVGGLNLTLSGGSQFNSFVWKTATLNTVLTEKQKEQYGKGNSKTRWDLQLERNVLQWTGTNGDSGIFVFSKDARVPALLSVCSEGASQMDMVPGQGMISVRKPVIYLYPTKEMSVDVSVQLKDMDFVAQYPKMQNGKWSVTALPSGDLVETASGKKFSYLFWEANSSKPWTIDEQSAFCVAGSDAADFLEDSLTRLGLNAKERNDFIVYWLPMLQANPFSLVQFLATEYTNKTPLSISPKPDTIIRVFMVFKAVDRNLETHPVKIRPVERRGFTVVEWGGTNLDEHGGRTA
ncbi:hypothetical protein HY213_02935 [Candidatus Peregrinibacteria bacterium]|nr:hypothetical protein [Candidatus Peregrinibacteria bacterium]